MNAKSWALSQDIVIVIILDGVLYEQFRSCD